MQLLIVFLCFVICLLQISYVIGNLFEHSVIDGQGNTISLSDYANAKVVVIGKSL